MRDKVAKGRSGNVPRGPAHHKSKLSTEDVENIRRLKEAGVTYQELADAYGMSFDGIRFIVKGLRRKAG